MPNCSVVGCRIKKSKNRPNITLHRLPKNDRRRKMWLDKIGVENLTSRTKTIFVCSLHFDESCFNTTLNITTLREDAVPSRIFLPPPALSSTSSTLSEVDPNQTPSSYKICDASDEVCRMCLVTSDRLFSIRTYNLEQAFEQLTGISLSEDDRLPQSLCSECATRLHNADSFRDRSLRAHNLMTDILKTNLHLTASALMSITTELQPKLHTKHYPANHCDVTLEHSDPTTEDIKSLEELDIKNEDEIFVDDLSPKEEAYADRGFDTDDSLPLEVAKKKKKKTQKKVKKIKTNEPKIDRRRKPFLNQDLNETLFTITDLTLEEQMAEVLKRQDTDNYKHSSFKCTECFKGFLDRDAYVSHMVRHTSECGEHRCDICKTHFKHSHALRKHITAHHLQRFSCNHCPYVTTHRQTARLHERWHKGTKYQCPHCNLEFLKFTTYMGHVRIKHPSDFVCELCGYSFVSAKGIELHKKLKHRGDDDVIPEDAPTCESCNVRFVSAEAYRRHLSVSARHATTHREHNKPTRSRKTMQDDREKSKNTDDDDKRRIYPSQMRKVEGPISCEQCGMQLEDSRAYHGHFRRMHPDKNRTNYPSMKSPCMCEVCGRIFQSFALLKDHTWVHTGERPFKCEQCGKSFRMKQRLVAHRRVHSEARTNYTCSLCGKHFSTHSNRQRHMFIHTGLKPFKCEMCGKGFKHASEKRAHVTYVHLKKPWPKRARTKRTHRPGSPNAGESEMDIQPAWPVCDPKLNDINMMDDKPLYYR